MDSFVHIMGRAERKNVDKDLAFSNKDSQLVYKLIREYFKKNPEGTAEDCSKQLLHLFYEINLRVMRMPSIKSDLIRYQTAVRLLNHDYMRKEAYERVISRERGGEVLSEGDIIQYTGNKKDAEDLLVIQSLIGLRASQRDNESMRDTINRYVRMTPKERRAIVASFSRENKDNLNVLVELFEGDEYTQFSRFLKSYEPIFRKSIRESSVQFLKETISMLSEFGTIESYEDQQQRILRALGLEKVTELLGAHPIDETTFSDDGIAPLELSKIVTLNAFWVNRLTKEIENCNTSLFIINSLGLWDAIVKAEPDPKTGEINIDVSEEDLEKTYRKVYFLRGLTDQIYTNGDEIPYKYVEDSVGKEGPNGLKAKPKKYKSIDIEALDSIIKDKYEDYYEEYFNKLAPGQEHNLKVDFDDYRIMDNAKKNAYQLKDNMMIAMLAMLVGGKASKNWGIVESSASSKFVIIAEDIQGLNLPVRLHIERNVVRDFLTAYNGDAKIPVYEGNDDFEVAGRQISTHFLIPVRNDIAQRVKEFSKGYPEGSDRKNFLEHMAYICGDTAFPQHLKINGKKKAGKTQKKRANPKYIDLKDGKTYVKNSLGQFQEEIKNSKEGWSIGDE